MISHCSFLNFLTVYVEWHYRQHLWNSSMVTDFCLCRKLLFYYARLSYLPALTQQMDIGRCFHLKNKCSLKSQAVKQYQVGLISPSASATSFPRRTNSETCNPASMKDYSGPWYSAGCFPWNFDKNKEQLLLPVLSARTSSTSAHAFATSVLPPLLFLCNAWHCPIFCLKDPP